MKQFKSIPVKLKNYAPITIKEPYKPDIKEFADTDEFTRYFRGNEDAFRDVSDDPEKSPHFLTANKLNRTYKIPGYRIRIIRKGTDNEELTLVKDYTGKSTTDEAPSCDELSNENTERIDHMEELIRRLAEQVSNIETFLCQLRR